MTNKQNLNIIYCTEFKNQFDVWQLLHATRSKEKALDDIGRSGRIVKTIEYSAYSELQKENEFLKQTKDAYLHKDDNYYFNEVNSEKLRRYEELKAVAEKMAEALKEMINICEWYANDFGLNGDIPQELHHFLAVEVRGDHGQALEEWQEFNK